MTGHGLRLRMGGACVNVHKYFHVELKGARVKTTNINRTVFTALGITV